MAALGFELPGYVTSVLLEGTLLEVIPSCHMKSEQIRQRRQTDI